MIVNQPMQRIFVLLVIFSTAPALYSSQSASQSMLSSHSSLSATAQADAVFDVESLCKLARDYQTGSGFKKDEKVAFELYELAAKCKNALAQHELGRCYDRGWGCKVDLTKAFEWYQLSASQNFARAQNNLAVCYERGLGCPVDLTKAFTWYQLAANQELALAQCNLGLCYEMGIGVVADKRKAIELYRLAIAQGNERARKQLAGLSVEVGAEVEGKKIAEQQEQSVEPGLTVEGSHVHSHSSSSHPVCVCGAICSTDSNGKLFWSTMSAQVTKASTSVTSNQSIVSQDHFSTLTAQELFELGERHKTGNGAEKNEKLAADLYHRAAEKDHSQAQYELGCCYEEGLGIEKNIKKAFELYQLSANKNYAPAQYKLARCYDFGYGVTIDKTKAFELYQLAADQDYAPAQGDLGVCYEKGEGIAVDRAKAVVLYQLAADNGDANARCNLGICCEFGRGISVNKVKAAELYQLSTNQGLARAQNRLALCYEYGQGVEKDVKKAAALYQLAANQGLAQAQYNFGICYEQGIGVEKNIKRATELYELAAEQGHEEAQRKVASATAEIFARGEAEKDMVLAVRQYQIAANRGHAQAAFQLGCCYDFGEGVAADLKKAMGLFQQAANKGERNAQYRLARCYEQGEGVEESPEKAFEYYQLAANQGHEEAEKKVSAASEAMKNYTLLKPHEKYALGEAHENGLNAAKDLKLAARFYELAAEDTRYAPAEYALGRCYECGIGLAVDAKKALEFYKSAGEKGDAQAQTKLGDFHKEGKAMCFTHVDQAFEWYTKAANQGNPLALYNLGLCYKCGSGVAVNSAKTFLYFQLAAKRGNQDAQSNVTAATGEMKKYISLDTQELCQLAEALSTGKDFVKDVEMAIELYRVAEARGNFAAGKRAEALNAEIKAAEDRRKKEAKDKAQASVASKQPAVTSTTATREQPSVSSASSSSLPSQTSSSAASVQNDVQHAHVERSREASTSSSQVGMSGAEVLLRSLNALRCKAHVSGDSSCSQQEVKAKAAQEAESMPCPLAYTDPLPKELRASVLEDCPTGIRCVLNLWGQYNVAWKLKNEQRCKELMSASSFPKKLLLFGPPGTGKSTMSRAIAEECDMSFLMYFASLFSNQYKSSGIQNLERIFRDAASLNKPCVIIIDELQALFQQYANKNDTDSNILILFWQLLDRYKNSPLFVIVTFNDLSETPLQIMDRSRIDMVEIPLPNEQKRAKLLSYYMEHLCGTSSEALANEFAAKTDTYSNRALEDFVSLAQRLHMMRCDRSRLPSREDFLNADKQLKEVDKKYKQKSKGTEGSSKVLDYILQAGHLITAVYNPVLGITNTYLAHKYHNQSIKTQWDIADRYH